MGDLANIMLRMVPWSLRGRIKSIPGLAQAQRAIVSRVFDGREFVHVVDAGPAKGITFSIRMPEDKGIWTGTYESGFATKLAAAVKLGCVAYDIGSWHGFFAGVMAARGASHVHVFEPLPQNAECIRKLIALNPRKDITLHACAMGATDTEMDLMIMPDTSMAKLEASTFQAGEKSDARVRVKVRSVDSVTAAGEAPPPSLMKIDVEGAEVMVLTGARETIRLYRPLIFAEVHSADLLAQCICLLEAADYCIEMLDANTSSSGVRDVFQIVASPAHAS